MKQLFIVIAYLVLVNLGASAQNLNEPVVTTRILFMIDASGSMQSSWQNNSRMNVAKKLMYEIADSLKGIPNLEIALRVYGHMSPRADKNCEDTRLEVPFKKNNYDEIKHFLEGLNPRGATPISYSLEQCGKDFPVDPFARNIVILITDGKESCNGDPCAVSLALQKQRIILKPFIIGLGLTSEVRDAFDCVGTFYDAEKEEAFKIVLKNVVAQAINKTTAQVNLNDKLGKPTETNVPVTFYDAVLGIERYNFIHTMNSRGVPDTMIIDPMNTYDIVVHTNPQIVRKGVVLSAGKHNNINISAPLGSLEIKLSGVSVYKELKTVVRKTTSCDLLSMQEANTSQKYLAGKYDITIPTLPPIYYNDLEIKAGETKVIQIPQPGKVSFVAPSKGYGSLFVQDSKNRLVKTIDLSSELSTQTISMQPGTYKVIFRSQRATATILSVVYEFTVKSGEFTTVKLSK